MIYFWLNIGIIFLNKLSWFMVSGEKKVINTITFILTLIKMNDKYFTPKITIMALILMTIIQQNNEEKCIQQTNKLYGLINCLQTYLTFSLLSMFVKRMDSKTQLFGIWLTICICRIHAQNITLSNNQDIRKPSFQFTKPSEKFILKVNEDNII